MYEYYNSNLKQEYKRHSVSKIPVSCLMAKDLHTDDGAKTSSYYGNNKKSGFGNAEHVLPGSFLVITHKGKSHDIHYYQI